MSAETAGDAIARLHLESALRRVATLAAQGADSDSVFGAISAEVVPLLGVVALALLAFDAGARMLSVVSGASGPLARWGDGGRFALDGCPLEALIVETGRPARIDDQTRLPGSVAQRWRAAGVGQAAGAPVLVDDSIWGFISAYAAAGCALPSDCESRLGDFSELMAAAIANARRRDELRDLAESQGALRRVATLVAQDADPHTVFVAVASEAARVLGVGAVSLIRYDPQTQLFTKIFGTHGDRAAVPDGGSWPIEDCPEGALILKTEKPARIDDWTLLPGDVAARHREQGFGQAVAAPVVLDGAIWGHVAAFGEVDDLLPVGCETRLADFTQLMASAMANAQTREELRGLAEQQGAALRRVATLVAQRAEPSTIFNAVAAEASHALRVPRVEVGRCHEDGSVALLGTTVARGNASAQNLSRCAEYVTQKVTEARRAARIDEWTTLSEHAAAAAQEEGFRSVVGAPINVDGALWGVIVVLDEEILGDDTEVRLTDFTHLVASSIANVQARDNLIASRARIVAASDEARRRIERNLHDGIQQRVISLGLSLRAVRARFALPPDAQAGLDDVARDVESVLEELQIFSQGMHPALLSRSGLGPSFRALARRLPIPVDLDVVNARLPEPVETAVYYVVSESLANATKHSRATGVAVTVARDEAAVRAIVVDDGVGGAVLGRGSGLIGLVDRVEALGGRFALESPIGRGTKVSVELPLRFQLPIEHPAP